MQPGPRELPHQCLIKRNKKTSTLYLYLALSPCKYIGVITISFFLCFLWSYIDWGKPWHVCHWNHNQRTISDFVFLVIFFFLARCQTCNLTFSSVGTNVGTFVLFTTPHMSWLDSFWVWPFQIVYEVAFFHFFSLTWIDGNNCNLKT